MRVKTICVFCSSSPHIEQKYKDVATEAGRYCATQGWEIVYGGAAGGMMGLVADAALAEGAHVTGVMPSYLSDQERAHKRLSRLLITKTLHDRQQTMADLSDAFLILPGGLGTLAEFFEVLTWKQIGLHKKPIFLLNAHGYWDGLCHMLEALQRQKFLHQPKDNLLTILESLSDLPKN